MPMINPLSLWSRKALKWASPFKRGLLSLLYPAQCCHCSAWFESLSPSPLCRECTLQLHLLDPAGRCRRCFSPAEEEFCPFCRRKEGFPSRCASVFDYEGASAALVKLYKYGGQRQLAESLASYMLLQFDALGWQEPDAVVPVPLSPVRHFIRGYNQSELLAAALARQLGVPLVKALKRCSGHYSQAGLNRSQRLKLGSGKISLKRGGEIAGRRLLLIDDVVTTGATLQACGRALAAGRPQEIAALTLCRSGT